MIFATVGTQLPFDRLIRAVDAWAAEAGGEAFAQIGDGAYRPAHMNWDRLLPAEIFRERVRAASVIVSHAGIGNLLLALQWRKPVIVMPRRASLGEHRNDHQLATAKWLRDLPGITVADDVGELAAALRSAEHAAPPPLSAEASPELIAAIRDFIDAR